MKSEGQKMRRFATVNPVMAGAILLLGIQPLPAQVQIDFTGVGTAVTLSDADRFFAARANAVNKFNACHGKLLVEMLDDGQDFTGVSVAKLEYGQTCPGEAVDV